jgi:hypothetical protein
VKVLNRVIKYSFAIVGATTGFTIANLVVVYSGISLLEKFKIIIYIAAEIKARS